LSFLSVWIIGYAIGCLAILPLLYWRYKRRNLTSREQDDSAHPHVLAPPTITIVESSPHDLLTPNPQFEILRNQINSESNFNKNMCLINHAC